MLSANNFWQRCVNAGCVVVPLAAYSDYVDGNTHPSRYVGLRYVALPSGADVVLSCGFFMLDESVKGWENYYLTPTEALKAYEDRKNERL